MRPTAHTSIADVLDAIRERLEPVATVALQRTTAGPADALLLVADGERASREVSSSSHAGVLVPLHALVPLADGLTDRAARLLALGAAEALLESALEALAPRGVWTSATRSASVRLALSRPDLRAPCAIASTTVTFRVPQSL